MELGAFSVSLAVKDLQASRAFYEKLGFVQVGGEPTQNWLILRNGTTTIGLFQGMFEKNILTFNPGWSALGEDLESFTDVRDIERMLRERGIEPVLSAAAGDGPAHVVVEDPDGNPVMIDQHVGRRE
ncbi:MAG: VOC family protein [Phycisphaerales bacterium]